ncbi:MAG: peptidoglycan DD-metalloendopeptidase family protein [Patescibacteria group bacterium]|jgi:murein DD-endopeptidase MepM/ murein hydrolase activator NlpD
MRQLHFYNHKYYLILAILLAFIAVFTNTYLVVAEEESTNTSNTDNTNNNTALQQQLQQLQNDIKDKQGSYNGLQDKITVYNDNLKSIQQKELTLNSQLEALDTQTELTRAEISQTNVAIEKNTLEQERTRLSIKQTDNQISEKQKQIQQLVRQLYEYDQKTFLEISLAHNTLSDFSNQIEYTRSLNSNLKSSLQDFQDLKQTLEDKHTELKTQQAEQEQTKLDLVASEQTLQGEADYKTKLLDEVQTDEAKFQELVKAIQAEQQGINSQITDLEKSARATLDKLSSTATTDVNTNTPFVYPTSFSPDWPVRGRITTTFRDPSYVFRSVFEHNAIDIAAPQGTPLKAVDSGVVGIVKFDGTSNYAYITIVHADDFRSLYGHVSKVFVEQGQPVQKGQTIALSGGMPGLTGTGAYSTGPHLHFSIYKGLAPVDPLLYLK